MRLKHFFAVALGVAVLGLGARLLLRQEPAPHEIVVREAEDAVSASASAPIRRDSSRPTFTYTNVVVRTEDYKKLQVLEEILAKQDDNDPRLDQEFKKLSDGAKHLLRSRYSSLNPEKRNERGTIVFLIGQNLSHPRDFEFLHEVLGEPPCLSLEKCDKEVTGGSDHTPGLEVTLAYPQMVALKSIERLLAQSSQADPALVSAALRELTFARRSSVSQVATLAQILTEKFEALHRR